MDVDHLADRLESFDEVTSVDRNGGVVGFDVDRGAYDSLGSELLTLIGEYDCDLYTFPDEEHKYRLV